MFRQPTSQHPRPHAYTHGGLPGHLLRRGIHISTFIIPVVFYHASAKGFTFYGLSIKQLVIIIVGIIVALEAVRLVTGIKVFGQRKTEARRIASFTWSAIGVGLVLLLAPGKEFAIPIIWSCAFGDPLLGELKCIKMHKSIVAAFGVVFIASIWLICYLWLGTPWWLVPMMGPLITAAEWPSFRWIDDNALMQLLPLAVVLVLF